MYYRSEEYSIIVLLIFVDLSYDKDLTLKSLSVLRTKNDFACITCDLIIKAINKTLAYYNKTHN